ncbi:pantoate--beta-alanine ligase [Allokutzneria sp. A3M-2-11 16]|uniref:pantoate--beta-alanine ligase n=1 Tax=Allokutzneria sp. A3M-2-11 16 TaxID=2962043 RepID=UPI0020B8F2F2|nr:pantoate--beta-alanine ligase [Allokutzneria sp. A3M-2-11 16]MCP3799930.1 pantoate--beta-alanine ligase [Allokutzneria sp. A3M-2-11 16]
MTSTPSFTRDELTVHTDPAELAKVTRALRGVGRRIALVPTMGALHDGHLELIRRSRRVPNTVTVVSIFVNPLQFGPGEDLAKYPRTLEDDLAKCRAAGVELVLAPSPEAIYGDDAQVTVHPGPLGDELEGAVRPGHFAGVLTVVAKLFNIVRPDYSFFGEKDYQQLVLIKRMVRDLDFETSVVGVPIVRDPEDQLALSSRNRFLSEAERASARTVPEALSAGTEAAIEGAEQGVAAARAVLDANPEVVVDYLELRGKDLGPAPAKGEARLLVAARVGRTRLIDNTPVLLGGNPEHRG